MIFVSYCHEDEKFCRGFCRMVGPLVRYGGIRLWSDKEIQAGKDWRKEIDRALTATSVAVLLVTDAFLDSHFIQAVELPYFIAAAKKRSVELLWVLVSDCLVERTPLKNLQAVLGTSTPIDSLDSSRQKTAWKKVAQEVDEAWQRYERPEINVKLEGRAVNRREPDLRLLSHPARRVTQIFVRGENAKSWWHQCSIAVGQTNGGCTFGNENTRSGAQFRIVALTTDAAVGGETAQLPSQRTRSPAVTVKRR